MKLKLWKYNQIVKFAGELGPLKYLAGLTGLGMDQIINYLLLVIIFVFDPLAISLVVAANFAFAQLQVKEEQNTKVITKTVKERVEVQVPGKTNVAVHNKEVDKPLEVYGEKEKPTPPKTKKKRRFKMLGN